MQPCEEWLYFCYFAKAKWNNALIDFVSIIDSDVQVHSMFLYKNTALQKNIHCSMKRRKREREKVGLIHVHKIVDANTNNSSASARHYLLFKLYDICVRIWVDEEKKLKIRRSLIEQKKNCWKFDAIVTTPPIRRIRVPCERQLRWQTRRYRNSLRFKQKCYIFNGSCWRENKKRPKQMWILKEEWKKRGNFFKWNYELERYLCMLYAVRCIK